MAHWPHISYPEPGKQLKQLQQLIEVINCRGHTPEISWAQKENHKVPNLIVDSYLTVIYTHSKLFRVTSIGHWLKAAYCSVQSFRSFKGLLWGPTGLTWMLALPLCDLGQVTWPPCASVNHLENWLKSRTSLTTRCCIWTELSWVNKLQKQFTEFLIPLYNLIITFWDKPKFLKAW